MQEISNNNFPPGDKDGRDNEATSGNTEDGRDKEWQDRARVNLEETPEGTKTNIERDFEPEIPAQEDNNRKKEIPPAY